MQGTSSTSGGHTACASCKHQRKKCDQNCILAPYFPAERNKEFKAVYEVFGVSNVQNMLKDLNEENRKLAADSLVWEAFWRQRDPVLGAYGAYERAMDELKLYKTRYLQAIQFPLQPTVGPGEIVMCNSGPTSVFGSNVVGSLYRTHNNGNFAATSSNAVLHSCPPNRVPTLEYKARLGEDLGYFVNPLHQNSTNGFNYQSVNYMGTAQLGRANQQTMDSFDMLPHSNWVHTTCGFTSDYSSPTL